MKMSAIFGLMMLSQVLFASVFDSYPFPTYLYPYQVHNQSSTVASGILERAEAACEGSTISPYYALRWDRPYSSYTRTLYAKYNLRSAIQEGGLFYLNQYFANTEILNHIGQFIYYDNLDSYLAYMGSDPSWFPMGGGPDLIHGELAVNVTGLREFPMITNLMWNSAPASWFKEGGATLMVTSNFNIDTGMDFNIVNTEVPRAFTNFAISERPPMVLDPYNPVPDWWIPYYKWTYDFSPDKRMGELDWENGETIQWPDTRTNNYVNVVYPTMDLPSAHVEPIYGGATTNVFPFTSQWFVYAYVSGGYYSNGRMISPAYSAFTNDNSASGYKIDWDPVPGAAYYQIMARHPTDPQLSLRLQVAANSVDLLKPYVISYSANYGNWTWPNAVPITRYFMDAPQLFNPDLYYHYNIPFSARQFIKYRTPPTVGYASSEGWETWDYNDTLVDLPLDVWVVTEEGLTYSGYNIAGTNGTGGTNAFTLASLESWRTISKTRKLTRIPTMSRGQFPVLDMYTRSSSAWGGLFALGIRQPWDTEWELLNPALNYPLNYEDIGLNPPPSFSPHYVHYRSGAQRPTGLESCGYDMDVVYPGEYAQIESYFNVKHTRVAGVIEVPAVDSTNEETIVCYTTPIQDVDWEGGFPTTGSDWAAQWVVVGYVVEERGIPPTEYRSEGRFEIFHVPLGVPGRPLRITSTNNTTDVHFYIEWIRDMDGAYNTHFMEGPIPAGGIILYSDDLNGGQPEDDLEVLGIREYIVTNTLTYNFEDQFMDIVGLEAYEGPQIIDTWWIPSYKICIGNEVVTIYSDRPYADFFGDPFWINLVYGTSTFNSNVVEEVVGNAWAVWTNTDITYNVEGKAAQWRGSRWLPPGTLQESVEAIWADPEKFNVDVWNYSYPYTLYNTYVPNSLTGEAHLVSAQWDVEIEYLRWFDDLKHDTYNYFVDPRNVLKWDDEGGFQVK
jgi:hypothetical protein